jgi:NADPH:quinone reductase-like Zn-dependent oxidoreductase
MNGYSDRRYSVEPENNRLLQLEAHAVWWVARWDLCEFVGVALKTCVALDQTRLCEGLDYVVHDLVYMAYLLVPFGGIRDIELQPGETIIVCPATGFYGSLSVQAALVMGAKVIALRRSRGQVSEVSERC